METVHFYKKGKMRLSIVIENNWLVEFQLTNIGFYGKRVA